MPEIDETENKLMPETEETEETDVHTEEATEPDTFPRAYVERLRAEAAEHRTRAQGADEARTRLLQATIREATAGVLADPTDLPVGDHLLDEDGFPDSELIRAAATELVATKPHLGDRRPRGSIGQGATTGPESVDLAGILRGRAS